MNTDYSYPCMTYCIFVLQIRVMMMIKFYIFYIHITITP